MSTATNGTQTLPAVDPFAGKAVKGGTGEKFDVCPPGNYVGRMIALIDLGTHDGDFKGKPRLDERHLFLAWELDVLDPNGNPFVLGQSFTVFVKGGKFVFGPKNGIRKIMEGIRGTPFPEHADVSPMKMMKLGVLVNVVSKTTKSGNEIAVIDSIKPMPSGMKAPAGKYDSTAYHISQGFPPVLTYLPKVFWFPTEQMEDVDAIVEMSKERMGKPIGEAKPEEDTPYSQPATVGGNVPVVVEDEDIPF